MRVISANDNLGLQKHSPRGVLIKRCSENMQQIFRRTPMRKCDCNKVALIKLLCNFIETTLPHGWSPANLLYIFRTPFYKNTFQGMLLDLTYF